MERINNLPYRSVALCGYRQKGRNIYQQLAEKNIRIPYIIERNYQALKILENDLGVPIVGFEEEPAFYEEADAILLTGDLPEAVVRESLELAGIKLPIVSDGILQDLE